MPVDDQAGVTRDSLITNNLRLVYWIVNRYFSKHLNRFEFDELVSFGNVGLVKAADRFDPMRNIQFSTYATVSITRYISYEIRLASRHGFHGNKADWIGTAPKSLHGFTRPGHNGETSDMNYRLIPLVHDQQWIDDEHNHFLVTKMFSLLTPRQVDVLRSILMEGQTLREVGKRLRITKERVRQIKLQAMEAIRYRFGVNLPEQIGQLNQMSQEVAR